MPCDAGAVALVVVGALVAWRLASGPRQPSVLQPFPGPPLKGLPQFGGEHEEGLLWGTYRPGYYFGAQLFEA